MNGAVIVTLRAVGEAEIRVDLELLDAAEKM